MKKLLALPKPLLILLGILLYIATAIPLGIAAYALKSSIGFNVFNRSGFHAVTYCIKKEYRNQRHGSGTYW